ncbi:DUF2851 family protein [Flavihumibacter petaseus]|uniref:DUF2851 family protein n=1 Tax=Flavihumibacter petaseus NBRC 106054 TaxID=1220578 RepID=A0A0E9N6I4_9BACT|nr:DUF2851 family protein [Flavihumibacter petaseus]GAO45336.1 hypothetical protein FPE01S_05_00330 [Flavihumibacter petaseus NBRC 106054]
MQEKLLQFIWQERYFDGNELFTETGEPLVVLDTGKLNRHQGPDFLDARLLIDGTQWAGNIELHTKSSYWQQHRHGPDPHYRNVILHVVWENDDRQLAIRLPTLVLQHRVSSIMLHRYGELMNKAGSAIIACSGLLELVPETQWLHWKSDLLHQRLMKKAAWYLDGCRAAGMDWNKATWHWIARQFGGSGNGQFFEQVARSIDWKILVRHRQHLEQLEALLLGQAGLLPEDSPDQYVQGLKREYDYLRSKYSLPVVFGQVQKLRMRPAAFPEVRLAQLAALIRDNRSGYARFLDCNTWQEAEQLFHIAAGGFWNHHYQLDSITTFQPKHLGSEMIQSLIINGIIPILYATGKQLRQHHFQARALQWLHDMPPEKNQVIAEWERLGVSCRQAGDSQALLDLRKNYCLAKRCLDCAIGKYLLKR